MWIDCPIVGKERVLVYDWKQEEFSQIYGFKNQIPVEVFEGNCVVDFTTKLCSRFYNDY